MFALSFVLMALTKSAAVAKIAERTSLSEIAMQHAIPVVEIMAVACLMYSPDGSNVYDSRWW